MELLTKNELAAMLKLSPRTIEDYVQTKRIQYLKIGGVVRFDKAVIEEWLCASVVEPLR